MSRARRRVTGLGIAILGFIVGLAGLFWLPSLIGVVPANFIGNTIGLPVMLFGLLFARQKPWTGGRITAERFRALLTVSIVLIAAGVTVLVIAEPLILRFGGSALTAIGLGLCITAVYRRNGTRYADAEASAMTASRAAASHADAATVERSSPQR
ncbi:hypothetical protein [Plantibacter sp. YIM 135249]|uniref:hypothetical protein n=1 Tax=Plantibacter sp. YIM 135249 TaxID=3423918 RepID=UPI003D34C904